MSLGEGNALPFFMEIWMSCFSFSSPVKAWHQRSAAWRLMPLMTLGLALVVMGQGSALALTADQTRALTLGDTDARITALQKALATPDAQTASFLQALADDAVKVSATRALASGSRFFAASSPT